MSDSVVSAAIMLAGIGRKLYAIRLAASNPGKLLIGEVPSRAELDAMATALTEALDTLETAGSFARDLLQDCRRYVA